MDITTSTELKSSEIKFTFEITLQSSCKAGIWPVSAVLKSVAEELAPRWCFSTLDLPDDWRNELHALASNPEVYGQLIGEALFTESLRALLKETLLTTEHIRMFLVVEAPELKSLHWERAYFPDETGQWLSFAQDQRILFSLYDRAHSERHYPRFVQRELKTLVVINSPHSDYVNAGSESFSPFDTHELSAQLANINSALPVTVAAPAILSVAPSNTWAAMTEALNKSQHHILHIICHGYYDSEREESYLVFQSEDRKLQAISTKRFVKDLQKISPLPHLIFLSSCDSAHPDAVGDSHGQFAQSIRQSLGTPAVIAMSGKVSQSAANTIAQAFYPHLLAEPHVDIALSRAGHLLYQEDNTNRFMPALRQRLGHESLFGLSEWSLHELNAAQITDGLNRLEGLLPERAPLHTEAFTTVSGALRLTKQSDEEAAHKVSGERLTVNDSKQLEQLDRFCQQVTDIDFASLAQDENSLPSYDNRCPFPGMEPFRKTKRQDFREFFFGRDADIQALIAKIKAEPIVAVVGSSGSGKSSLAFAGVLPAMEKEGWQLLGEQQEGIRLQLSEQSRHNLSLQEQLDQTLEPLQADQPALLYLDQFEQVFIGSHAQQINQRKALFERLLKLSEAYPQLRILLTIRADYALEDARAHLGEIITERRYDLSAFSTLQLRQLMDQQVASVVMTLEEGLAHRIQNEVIEGQKGVLPLLQYLLWQLWQHRLGRMLRTVDYESLNGIQQVVTTIADRVFDQYAPNDDTPAESKQAQYYLRNIFMRLTQPDKDRKKAFGEHYRDIKQPVPKQSLYPQGADKNVIDNLLVTLNDKRLITTRIDVDSEDQQVEIVHESLIQHWSKLRGWLQDRQLIEMQQELSEYAQVWKDQTEVIGQGKQLRLEKNEYLRHSGSQIATIRTNVTNQQLFLNSTELAYLGQCESKDKIIEKNRKRVKVFARVMAGLAVVAVIAALVAFDQRNEAKENELDANYKLAQVFNQKSQSIVLQEEPLSKVAYYNSSQENEYRKALLYALEAQLIPLPEGKKAISAATIGKISSIHSSTLNTSKYQTPGVDAGSVSAIAYSPDGKFFATGSLDSFIRIWNAQTLEVLSVLKGHSDDVRALVYSPNGKVIASGSYDNTVRLWNSRTHEPIATFIGHSDVIGALAYSPDGQFLASGSEDKTIRLWRAQSGEIKNTLIGHSGNVNALAYSPDGRHLASGSNDNTIRIWNSESGENIDVLKGEIGSVQALAFSPDGKELVSGSDENAVHVWNPISGKVVDILEGHTRTVKALVYRPDGKYLASGSKDNTIRIWNRKSGGAPILLTPQGGSVETIAYSPDGKTLASASMGRGLRLWDPQFLKPINNVNGHAGTISALAYSPDGKSLASGSWDNTIRTWDSKSGETVNILNGHSRSVKAVVYSPDNNKIASGSEDRTIRIWDAQSGNVIKVLNGHSDTINALEYSYDGRRLSSGSDDNTIRVWDSQSYKTILTLKGHSHSVKALAQSPDGKHLASGSEDETIRIWDLKSGKTIEVLNGHSGPVGAVTFSPDGKVLASSSGDGTRKLWDTQLWKPIATLQGYRGWIISTLAYSPDGKIIISESKDSILQWDAKSFELINAFKGHARGITAITYSPNGKTIATGSKDGTIKLWDAQAFSNTRTPELHSNPIMSLAYSPDGKILASGSEGKNIRLWNAQSFEFIKELEGHSNGIMSLVFSPDSMTLVSGSEDKTIRVWNINSGETIKTLRGHTGSVIGLAYSPNGKLIASGSSEIIIWNARSLERIKNLKGDAGGISALSFSPDSQAVAAAAEGKSIRIWDTQSFDYINTPKAHFGDIIALTYSPDGKTFASGAIDNTIRIWDVSSTEIIQTLESEFGIPVKLIYSPDGRVMISGTDNHTVQLWDARSYELITTLEVNAEVVFPLAYRPDGEAIVSGSEDGTIQIWRPNDPMFRFVNDFKADEVSGVLRFLWELELDGLDFKYTPRFKSLSSKMGHHIAWTDQTQKYRPLLKMPLEGDTKMDQVLHWLEDRCAYKRPKRFACTPKKD